MMQTLSDRAAYVRALELPMRAPAFGALEEGGNLLQQLQDRKAALVGSEIIAFVQGVTPERRQLVVQSSLLAQLVAKKRVPDASQLLPWYDVYRDVLQNIGWAIQAMDVREFEQDEQGLDAHEGIIQAATVLLGPNVAALNAVIGTIQALKSVGEGKPWFTLFHREAQAASTAHFQVSLVHPGEGDSFMVSLMACLLKASSGLTQVAFFKFRSEAATLQVRAAEVTVGLAPGSDTATAIAKKVADYQREYVMALDL